MGLVMVVLLFLTGLKYPTHLYSPGDLTNKHKDLRCKDCHAPFKKVPTESCQAQNCHPKGKIGKKAMVKDLHESPDFEDCMKCHTDHKGDTAKITKAFDHAMLPGGAKDCLSCHKTEYAKGHKDKAREKCADCHDTKDWKKTSFNHATQTAACRDCHNSPKDALHEGVTGSCKDCHALDKGWKSAAVDHVKYFPLTRSHKVPCAKCHDTGSFKKYTCLNCHEHSTRGIMREHQEEGIKDFGDCLRCHSMQIDGQQYGNRRTHEGIGGEGEGGEGYSYKGSGKGKGGDDD